MSVVRQFVVLLSFVLLSACVSNISDIPTESVFVPTARIKPTITSAPTETATTSAPNNNSQNFSRTQYNMEVFFDFPNKSLQVEQSIIYLNTTGENLASLLLIVEPNRYPNAFELVSLDWGDGQYVPRYTLEGAMLKIPISNFLAPGDSLELLIRYNIYIPFQPSAFGYTARQTNLADWYPIIPPYQSGEGWLYNPPAQVGEHQIYDIADYKVTIRSPDPGLIIASPGMKTYSASGLVIELSAARGMIWSASVEYQLQEIIAADLILQAYVFPEHVAAAQYALEAIAASVELFEELFGEYPRSSLTLIEADFYDGYESDGAFFLDEVYFWDYFRSPNNYLTTLAAHETAHQWWYAQVGSNQAQQPWLDEAIATYSELLFYERYYPDQTGWWWQFRVQRLNPVGYVNTSIYQYDNVDLYVNAVYLRGASFLRDLRALIGDDAFFTVLREYYMQGKFQQTTSEDFFSVLAKYSSEDISSLLAVYFE